MLLKHPLSIAVLITLLVGAFLIVLGLILFAVLSAPADFPVLLAVGLNGVVVMLLGVIFALVSSTNSRRIRRYKRDGRQFSAEIVELNPVAGIATGTTPAVYAVCIYTNDSGQRCKVKSSMFLWRNFQPDSLQAEVYVDWNAPHRYAVEITRRALPDGGVDIDYT